MSDSLQGTRRGGPGRTLKAGAVLAVFLAVFLLIDRLSGPDEPRRRPPGSSVRAATQTTAAATTTTTTTRPTTTTKAPTTAPSTSRPTATTRAALPSAEGVLVQILNGTGELRVARDFKPLVRKEGYRVVNTANANPRYAISTVLYTSGHRDDAVGFQRRFPAFRTIKPAPANLSRQVALHVVIGENYRP